MKFGEVLKCIAVLLSDPYSILKTSMLHIKKRLFKSVFGLFFSHIWCLLLIILFLEIALWHSSYFSSCQGAHLNFNLDSR